jgi:hypothetical protein
VLRPIRQREFDLGPGQADVVESHAHRTGYLMDGVAAPLEIGSHRRVALVHPGGKPRDAGSLVRGLHGGDGVGALGRGKVACQQGVVVDAALRVIGKDRSGNARKARKAAPLAPVAYSSQEATRVSAPRR